MLAGGRRDTCDRPRGRRIRSLSDDAKLHFGERRESRAESNDRSCERTALEEITHGEPSAESSVCMLGGYFAFDPINKSMLLDFLPKMLRIRANQPAIGSVATIVELIQREARDQRPGRNLVLSRLIEVMLVEALRSAPPEMTATGLLAGLRDPQLAAALHAIHTKAAHPWSLASLAREAAMSRSSFADRIARVVGLTPLNYLLQWRLAIAKRMLAREQKSVGETALDVGYESASGFSTAFSRAMGMAPKQFAEIHRVTARTV